jgi:hypothetical protein
MIQLPCACVAGAFDPMLGAAARNPITRRHTVTTARHPDNFRPARAPGEGGPFGR